MAIAKIHPSIFFVLSSLLILTIIVFLALPYPFCPLSWWLETLIVKDFNPCPCLCPWWLFILLQLLISLILKKYFQTRIKHQRRSYLIAQIINLIFINLFHWLMHRYYIAQQVFDPSVFCRYFILISLLLGLISLVFQTKKKSSGQQSQS